MFVVRRGVEVVSRFQMIFAEMDVAFEDEAFLASGVIVRRVRRAGLEFQQEGGRTAGGFIEAQHFDGDTGDAGFAEWLPRCLCGVDELISWHSFYPLRAIPTTLVMTLC